MIFKKHKKFNNYFRTSKKITRRDAIRIALGVPILFATSLAACVDKIKQATIISKLNKNIIKHFDGQKFYNPNNPEPNLSIFRLLKWRLFSTKEAKPWPKQVAITPSIPSQIVTQGIRVTFIGHSTTLVQIHGFNILLDPIWSERASPVSFAGPKRVAMPGIKFDDLPKIDLVLISHNHYDHMDLKSINLLWEKFKPNIITPLNNAHIIKNNNKKIVVLEYDWFDEIKIQNKIGNTITIAVLEAVHWSARGIFDRRNSLWAAYAILSDTGKIYFAGDTGFGNGNHFSTASKKYGEFDLTIMPIGAYKPNWFMKQMHISPTEAVKAIQLLKSKHSLGVHIECFKLSDESYFEARNLFNETVINSGLEPNKHKVMTAGEQWQII